MPSIELLFVALAAFLLLAIVGSKAATKTGVPVLLLFLALGMLAPTAALGQLHTGHGPLMGPPASEGLRLTVASLFPASALHAAQRDDLVLAWTRQMGAGFGAQDLARASPELVDNAYRNLIVPPLALGLSLLFALLNLAQLAYALLRSAALL